MITLQGYNLNFASVTTLGQILKINPSYINASGNPQNTGNYVTQICEMSSTGSATGTQYQSGISNYYKEKIGVDTLLFSEKFYNGTITTVSPANRWFNLSSTYSSSYSANTGYFTLNSANTITTTGIIFFFSQTNYTIYNSFSTTYETNLQIKQPTVSTKFDKLFKFGLGNIVQSTGVIKTGIYFIYKEDNSLYCVISPVIDYNSTGGLITNNQDIIYKLPVTPSFNVFHTYKIVIFDTFVNFFVDNILVKQLFVDGQAGTTLNLTNVRPIYIYTQPRESTVVTNVLLNWVTLSQNEVDQQKPFSHILSIPQGSMINGQQTETPSSTSNLGGNNTSAWSAPAGNTLSNTTTTATQLGGFISFQVNGTVEQDGIVCSYQKPTPTISNITKNQFITSVWVQGIVTTVIVGGPIIAEYSLSVGNTAISLATTESATTKSSRRIPIGIESYATNAAVNTTGGDVITRTFTTPIMVQPGEFIQLVYKNIGVNPSSGVISVIFGVNGWTE